MKGYQSFKMNPPISYEEFLRLMQERWDEENNGPYAVGKPHDMVITKEEYVLLPATDMHMIIARPRKKKMTLTVCVTNDGALTSLKDAGRRLRRGSLTALGDLVGGTTIEKDRTGPAEQALLFYTARLKEMLADYL